MDNIFVIVYSDKWKAIHSIKAISEKERMKLAAALLDYGCLGLEPKGLSNVAQGMFDAIKSSLFAKGKGGQIGNKNASKNKNEYETNNKTNDVNECKNECEKTNKNELYKLQTTNYKLQTTTQKKDKEKSATASSLSRFHKPTVDEVRAYIQEQGYHVNPNDFVNFYESKGWLVGKTPMRDWKAAVRTWESKEKNENPAKFVEEKEEFIPITPLERCQVCGSKNVATKGLYSICNGCGVSYRWNNRWVEDN